MQTEVLGKQAEFSQCSHLLQEVKDEFIELFENCNKDGTDFMMRAADFLNLEANDEWVQMCIDLSTVSPILLTPQKIMEVSQATQRMHALLGRLVLRCQGAQEGPSTQL